jgi:hypothetical protein
MFTRLAGSGGEMMVKGYKISVRKNKFKRSIVQYPAIVYNDIFVF